MRLDDSYSELTQWDTGRKIILDVSEICDQVHFSNKTFGKTVDVLVYKLEDSYVADIPDELLQSTSPLTVYCYIVRDDGETTTISETFHVRKRNKPTDYIYNPEPQTRIKEFNEFVDDTIDEIIKTKTEIDEATIHQPIIQNGTWRIWNSEVNNYIDTEMPAQGPKGDKGDTGEIGYTPIRGVDYWTDEDKAVISADLDDKISNKADETISIYEINSDNLFDDASIESDSWSKAPYDGTITYVDGTPYCKAYKVETVTGNKARIYKRFSKELLIGTYVLNFKIKLLDNLTSKQATIIISGYENIDFTSGKSIYTKSLYELIKAGDDISDWHSCSIEIPITENFPCGQVTIIFYNSNTTFEITEIYFSKKGTNNLFLKTIYEEVSRCSKIDSVNLLPIISNENIMDNSMIKSDGTIITSRTCCVIPKINLNGNTQYIINYNVWGTIGDSISDSNKLRCYDSEGTALSIVSPILLNNGYVYFTTPENTSYMSLTIAKRIYANYDKENINKIIGFINRTIMIVEGDSSKVPKYYESYKQSHNELANCIPSVNSIGINQINKVLSTQILPLRDKNIVCFGDSITANGYPTDDMSLIIQQQTGANVTNMGFGGCRMSQHTDNWDAFSMYRIVYSIVNNDWTLQETAIADGTNIPGTAIPFIRILKTIDFNDVDIVTIAYGTNDWSGCNPIDNSDNSLDTTTYKGAARYSIEMLLTTYPNISIILISPSWRCRLSNGSVTTDSDSETNNSNLILPDYCKALKEVSEEYHLKYIDMYNNTNFNKFTASIYFPTNDGIHPNLIGRQKMASIIAHNLY